MKARATLPFVLLLAIAAGCAQSGRRFDPDRIPFIQPERSTQADVRRIFGDPASIGTIASGGTRWSYLYEETTSRDTGMLQRIGAAISSIFGYPIFWSPVNIAWDNTTRHELSVLFDGDGVVRDYAYERTEIPTRRVY
jgi:outer membrane protein assembly factor BamE (lipoprotein component of BamABCDE complex)